MASLRLLNGEKQASATTPSAAANLGTHRATDPSSTLQSNSINFIKNKTGELLLFKPGR